MKFIIAILSDLRSGSNLDLSIPAAIGLVSALLGLIGAIGFEVLAAAILLVLSALAGSLMANRHQAGRVTGHRVSG